MNCKKMNVMALLVLLMAAFFIGCQIAPPGPGGGNGNGNGNNGCGATDVTVDLALDHTVETVIVTFVNKTGHILSRVEYFEYSSADSSLQKADITSALAVGGSLKATMNKGQYNMAFFDAGNNAVGGGNGYNISGNMTIELGQLGGPVDPTGDMVAVTFVNKTGFTLAKMEAASHGGVNSSAMSVLLEPAVAPNGSFDMNLVKGTYNIAVFDSTGKVVGGGNGFDITKPKVIELTAVGGGTTDPTNDVTVTFINKSGKSIAELKYIQAMVQGATEQIKTFNPPVAVDGQFTLTMQVGNYSFVAFEKAGNAANPVALVEGVFVGEGTTVQLTPSQGGTNPAEQCIDFVNLYKEFATVEYRLPGQTTWGTLIPEPAGQGPQSLAVGKNLSLPFPGGTKFDMRFTTASGEAVTLLDITTAYRYGYINITGAATSSVAQEFGKRNRAVTLVNTTLETLTSYYTVDQINVGQPQQQFLTTPLAPGQTVSLTLAEGIYIFQFMAGPSMAGETDVTVVTADLTTDIYEPAPMPGTK